MKNKIRASCIIWCGIVGIGIPALLITHDLCLKNKATYAEGTVYSVNAEENDVTIRVGDSGPRIYVEDLGGYSLEDIHYGDTVEMYFQDGFYHITKVKEGVEE
jgi:hypothetical protein